MPEIGIAAIRGNSAANSFRPSLDGWLSHPSDPQMDEVLRATFDHLSRYQASKFERFLKRRSYPCESIRRSRIASSALWLCSTDTRRMALCDQSKSLSSSSSVPSVSTLR